MRKPLYVVHASASFKREIDRDIVIPASSKEEAEEIVRKMLNYGSLDKYMINNYSNWIPEANALSKTESKNYINDQSFKEKIDSEQCIMIV